MMNPVSENFQHENALQTHACSGEPRAGLLFFIRLQILSRATGLATALGRDSMAVPGYYPLIVSAYRKFVGGLVYQCLTGPTST